MNATGCPEEHELLELHAEGSLSGAIRAHVDGCPTCQLRLARLGAEVANLRDFFRDATSAPSETDSLAPPRAEAAPLAAVGKYVVLESLGRGGQADVYRAAHPTLGKEVVIKLAREPGADRSALAAEGKVLAELNHPGLVRVYDLDFHEGCPFLVMEYVPACDLRRYVAQHPLGPDRAALFVAKVARALAVAHRKGVVHQDLKPNNILVTDGGEPRVIDFGLARLTHGWADPGAQPDGGTVSFMAPEQARGESDRVDARSDIFALGGVLYFLLTGGPPFPGKTFAERLDKARRCDFDASVLKPSPTRLRAICLRAMAADPANRYPTAEDFAADLERFASRPSRRAVLLAGAGVALAAAGVGWWQFGRRRPVEVVQEPDPQKPTETPPPPPLPANPLAFRLRRDGNIRNLATFVDIANVVPFREGDEVQIQVQVPGGLHASLFWVESDGTVRHLADGAGGQLLSFPPEKFAPFEGDGGTELVLACWRASGPATVAEINDKPKIEPWPALPFDRLLRLDREKVDYVGGGRPLGEPRDRSDPEGQLFRRLEALRQSLRDRFTHVLGAAFLYQG